MSAAQSVGGGFNKRQEYQAQDQEVRATERTSALQYSRDLKDTNEQTDAALARRRAILAANGAAGTAQQTALLDATAATGGQNVSRLSTDYKIAQASLKARRAALKQAGQKAALGGIFNAPLAAFGSYKGAGGKL